MIRKHYKNTNNNTTNIKIIKYFKNIIEECPLIMGCNITFQSSDSELPGSCAQLST